MAQTYDRDGNVTSESRSLTGVSGDAGSATQSFTYDGANRVVLASGLTDSAAYLYDHDSNRVAAAIGSSSTGYAYDRAGQLVSRVDGGSPTSFSYDAYGNQTQAAVAFNAVTTSTYDAADRLLSITPPGQGATSFSLDALGRHATRTIGSLTEAYAYLGTSETVWQITTGASTLSAAREPSGALAAIDAAGSDGFVLADLHGNLAAVVNAADSAYLSATRYDAFGQSAASYDSGSSYPTPWGFQSRLDISPDASEPLYDFSARFYAPSTGAFTQLDTYAGTPGDPLSLNRYLYAAANPWTLIDPDGHRFMSGVAPDGGSGCRAPCTTTPAPQKSTDPIRGANAPGATGSGTGTNANRNLWTWYPSESELHYCGSACDMPLWSYAAAGAFDVALFSFVSGLAIGGACAITGGVGCLIVGGSALALSANPTVDTIAYATDPTTSPEDSAYAWGGLGGSAVFGLGAFKAGMAGFRGARGLSAADRAAVTEGAPARGTVAGERATIHGAERLAQAGFTEQLIAQTRAAYATIQADGARVYIREASPGRFDFFVEGTNGIITAHRGWSFTSVGHLAANYGWKGWPP